METNNKKNFVMPAVLAAIVILLVGTGYLATREDTVKAPAEIVSTSTPKTTISVTPSASTKTDVSIKTQVTVPIKTAPATNVSVSGKSSIELLSPNDGAESFAIDTSNTNASIPVDFVLMNVNSPVFYLVDSSGKIVTSATTDIDKNANSYIFHINREKKANVMATGDYKIKICNVANTVCDTSEKGFRINFFTSEPASVKIMAPNGGEVWKIGSRQTISFAMAGDVKSKYSLVLTLEPKQGVIATVPITSTSYAWTIPKNICREDDYCEPLSPGYYRIKSSIYDGTQLIADDESNMNISITN
ncbi:MAG: hypothetical protein AAB610_00010 [Patescibacteria group bacterium]